MVDHAARDHATWSASATERNWNCAGALALTKDLPESTSEAADWGTVCHEISEICLREGRQAIEFIGETRKGKKYEFEIDDEMAETAQTYIDYVRQRVVAAAPKGVNPATLLQIEQYFSLADLKPPFDAGGTGDAVIYFPAEELLEVVDLKGGRGVVVEAENNKQGRTYGLGAVLANPKLKVKRVRVTIVQPRAPHRDGRIRSDDFDVIDLMDWTMDLLAAMRRSAQALADYGGPDISRDFVERHGSGDCLSDAEWQKAYLSPGPHCEKTFCKAMGFCPAVEQKALDEAGIWFDDLDQPRLSNTPDTFDPAELSKKLDMLDMIEAWCKAVRAYAHSQAESGVEIPDYMLVDKVGHRAWKDGVAAEAVAAILKEAGKDPAAAYQPPKLSSPAQVEKVGGVKVKTAIADLIERPIRGTNLVRADKTTRPAATPAAHKHFDILA